VHDNMTGIALEGGAERCSFSAGVLDQLMECGFTASAVSGTSAGAGCAINYRSAQTGISLEMMKMSRKNRYFGLQHMAQTGRFVNLDDMVARYALQIDFPTYFSSATSIDFTATCCESGLPAHLSGNHSKRQLLTALKASCALPIICQPVEIDGLHYVDGSIADPIPFAHLLENGCSKVLVILTGREDCRPTDYRKLKPLLWKYYKKSYPKLYHAILNRISLYEQSVHAMQRAVAEQRVFVIRPQMRPIPLFTQRHDKIDVYYQHGRSLAKACWPAICDWLHADILSAAAEFQEIPATNTCFTTQTALQIF